jgi:riboflavin synthase
VFTGIVQGMAKVRSVEQRPGLLQLTLELPPGFDAGLALGASVSVDGVCLTVNEPPSYGCARFDVMQQTLLLTTLGGVREGDVLNVERAASEGAEVGGHVLSGHIDVCGEVLAIQRPQNNHVLRIGLAAPWMRYVFAKGYIAVNGASLTVAQAYKAPDGSGWFEVWLIPETLRATTFARKDVGTLLNIEIERQTQVIVETVRAMLEERLGPLMPALEQLLAQRSTQGARGDENPGPQA